MDATLTTATGGHGGGAATNSGGDGGADGAGGAGGAGAIEPADPPCLHDLAFRAIGTSFVAPTPIELAMALDFLSYDSLVHPLSVVLRAGQGAADATLAASATEPGDGDVEVFPAGKEPDFRPAQMAHGGFSSQEPQHRGYLRVFGAMGFADIELGNLWIEVSTSGDCSAAVVQIDAVIDQSQGSVVLPTPDGNKTLAQLAGGTGQGGGAPMASGWQLRALFAVESVSFDFDSL